MLLFQSFVIGWTWSRSSRAPGGAWLEVDERAGALRCFGRSRAHTFSLDGEHCAAAPLDVGLFPGRVYAFDLARDRVCFADLSGDRISVRALDGSENDTTRFPTVAGGDVWGLAFDPKSGAILVAAFTNGSGGSTFRLGECCRFKAKYVAGRLMAPEIGFTRSAEARLCVAADTTRERVWLATTSSESVASQPSIKVCALDWETSAPAPVYVQLVRGHSAFFLLADATTDGAILVSETGVMRLNDKCEVRGEWQLPEIDRDNGEVTSVAYHGPTNTLYLAAGSRLRAMQLNTASSLLEVVALGSNEPSCTLASSSSSSNGGSSAEFACPATDTCLFSL